LEFKEDHHHHHHLTLTIKKRGERERLSYSREISSFFNTLSQ
jgi:hypothetical protein